MCYSAAHDLISYKDISMKIVILIVLSLFSIHSIAMDVMPCDEALEAEKAFAAKLPIEVNDVTTFVQFSVFCASTTVKYVKRVSLEASPLNRDMQEDEQRKHTILHCQKNGLAGGARWTVREYWYDVNMELIAEFKTTPDMCS
jgi:hypothetical protein